MSQGAENPYVGPRTYERGENAFFFGREREARDLLSSVISEPLILFYARSGAGKSSLINMRLIPSLESRGFQVLTVGRVSSGATAAIDNINNIFVFNLIQSIDQAQTPVEELANHTLNSYLSHIKPPVLDEPLDEDQLDDEYDDFDEPVGRVLIIDQFEEIITTNLERWQDRETFFYQLGQAIWHDPLLWVVLSVREDYVAALQPFAPYLPGKLTTRFHMQRLGLAAAHEAIVEPAQQSGQPFAPGVAEQLVRNLSQIRLQGQDKAIPGQYIEPVQLQIVCYQLWEKSKEKNQNEIAATDLDQLGEVGEAVDNALAQFYQQALVNVRQQADVQEATLRNWFEERLITEAQTRGTVYEGATHTGGLDNKIVSLLANQYLLRAERRASGRWYELIHDRFVEPILQDNRRWWNTQNPLIRAATDWVRSGRLENKLYQGQQFVEAFAAVDLEALEPQVREFWEACNELEKNRRLEEALQRTEKEDAQAKADVRTRRRLRVFNYFLAVAIIFTIIATIFAALSTSEAITQQGVVEAQQSTANSLKAVADAASTRAVNNSDIANEQSTVAAEQKATAESESTRAIEQKAVAEAESTAASQQQADADAASTVASEQRLTAEFESTRASEQKEIADEASTVAAQQADLFLAQSLAFSSLSPEDLNNDTELAILLALEALRINQELDGDLLPIITQGLLPALNALHFNVTLHGHDGAVNDIALSPLGGRWLASAGADGAVLLWDLSQQHAPAQKFTDHNGAVTRVLITADGYLISAGQDSTIYIRPLNNLTDPIVITETAAIVDMTYKDSNQAFATSLENGRVHLRYLTDGILSEPELLDDNNGQAATQPIAFKNRSNELVVAKENGRFVSIPLSNPFNLSPRPQFHNAPITALAISSDDTNINTGSTKIHVDRDGNNWEAREHSGIITDIAIPSQDPQTFITTGRDGTIRLWEQPGRDLIDPPPPLVLTGHQGAVLAVAIASDGRFFATSGADGTIRLWRLDVPVKTLPGGISVQFSPDGAYLANVNGNDPNSQDDELNIYSTANFDAQPQTKSGINDIVKIITFSDDGQTLLSGNNNGGQNGIIMHWELDSASAFVRNTAALSPLYEVDALVHLNNLDGRATLTAAAGFPQNYIGIWNWKGNILTRLEGHNSPIVALAYASEQRLLFSATSPTASNASTFYWNMNGIDLSANVFDEHSVLIQGGAQALTISDDQQLLAAAQNSIRLWSLSDLSTPLYTLNNSGAGFRSLAISPDSRWLAAAGNGLYLWDLTTPEAEPLILSTQIGYVTVDFSADGTRIAAGTATRTELWPLVDQLPEIACQQVRRNLSPAEWERYLGKRLYKPTCENLPAHPSNTVRSETALQQPPVGHFSLLFSSLLMLTAAFAIVIQPRSTISRETHHE